MQIDITGDGVELTDALRSYIHKRLDGLQNHGEHITHLKVILRHDSNQHLAEGNLHVAGRDINAKAASDNMYTSIDELSDKLEVQLSKYKDKHKDHHRE